MTTQNKIVGNAWVDGVDAKKVTLQDALAKTRRAEYKARGKAGHEAKLEAMYCAEDALHAYERAQYGSLASPSYQPGRKAR